jgi:hypothetical protein
MKTDLTKRATPEEVELFAKQIELGRISAILAERELDLEDLTLSVARFQHRYYAELGKRYVELDELRAQIAEHRARRVPRDAKLKQQAQVAREEASKTASEHSQGENATKPPAEEGESSGETKTLYRKIASTVHPDKATDEHSRHLRTKLMAELNEAYARKDVRRMKAILSEWDESPDAIPGDGTGAELVRTIRAIAQVKRRIAGIEQVISQIPESDIHKLMTTVHDADLAGRNILAEMAEALNAEIREAEAELKTLGR